MLIDYHLHNHFSPDSESDTSELLMAEWGHGVRHVCFTNHAEWFPRGEEIAGVFSLEEALDRFTRTESELNGLRPRFPDMDIRLGAEIQFQPESLGDLEAFIKKIPLDFVLGSVHTLGDTIISGGRHAHEAFGPLTEKQAYVRYFETLLELADWGKVDAIAHFDIIKKFGHLKYGPFKPSKFKAPILRVIRAMKAKGLAMELNGGSLHKNCFELFPHSDILKWCLQEGLDRFTFGSDAHETHRAGRYIPEIMEIAKEVGITHVCTYKNRKATRHPIGN